MRQLVLLLGLLCVSHVWAKSTEVSPEENEIEKEGEEAKGGYDAPQIDPCYDHVCPIGHECDIDDDQKPVCICAHTCTPETDDRAKVNVCSSSNETFSSECELFRQKCLCEMDYFGPCKDLGVCEEWEMEEYPRRMREWLYLIMEELDNRQELTKKASRMAKKAHKMEKKWVIPVVWKFCDLDTNPDDEIDFHELIPISAPLKPLEHCTADFLKKCDEDSDGLISKWEWGSCLGLETEEMDERCEEFLDEE